MQKPVRLPLHGLEVNLVNLDDMIVLPGGAGLVGQNLVARLRAAGFRNIVVLDKHRANLAVLQKVQPEIVAEYADLAEPGPWSRYFTDASVVVMLQAQIGGIDAREFERNNVEATRLILEQIKLKQVPYLVHISSSVVKSIADDLYTNSKKAQEELVVASGVKHVVLRPTLMFGWFDRKHLGWLSRFMKKVPIFPIPGHGRYMRQPLYSGDFCNVIMRCMQTQPTGQFNISGHEQVDYVDIIKGIRRVTKAKTVIAHIPYGLFHTLLKTWAVFDKNPPFTTEQLKALVARDEFEVIDWPGIFQVKSTPFAQALDETFNDPRYSHVVLDF